MTEPRYLLVEDESPKIRHITKFLEKLEPSVSILVAKSVSSALDKIEEVHVDLIVLDMSLPTFDVGHGEAGGRPQGTGGIEILRNLKFLGLKTPVVVLTGYEAFQGDKGGAVELSEIKAELLNEFRENLLGVLHYNSTLDEWKIELKSVLTEINRSKDIK